MEMMFLGYGSAIAVFCIGIYTIVTKKNLFKTVVGLSLMEGGVLLFMVTSGFVPGGGAPLLPLGPGGSVNPLPHSFTLTAIVIGASDVALALAFIIKIHRHYGTVDIDKIRGLRG
jgi:multicomponent Na+:H+ antiporter subunit C